MEAASQQIKKLTAEAEHAKAAREETGLNSSDGKAVASPDQEAKINALYGTLPSIDKLSPALPLTLERLRTLRHVHTSAWHADQVLSELERRQALQEGEIKQWERQLVVIERDIKKSEKAMVDNIKVVGTDVKMLEERMAKLFSENHPEDN